VPRYARAFVEVILTPPNEGVLNTAKSTAITDDPIGDASTSANCDLRLCARYLTNNSATHNIREI